MSNLLVCPLLEHTPDTDRQFSEHTPNKRSENPGVLKVGVGIAVLISPVVQLPRLIRG